MPSCDCKDNPQENHTMGHCDTFIAKKFLIQQRQSLAQVYKMIHLLMWKRNENKWSSRSSTGEPGASSETQEVQT